MSVLVLDRPIPTSQGPLSVSLAARAVAVAGRTLATWETRARTRAALRAMCATRYEDVGLSTAEVLREGAKPFWRA